MSKKDTLLLVDDERHLLMALGDFLKYEDFNVVVAQSGEEALIQIENTTPDLIVLDISMPGMGGIGFLKAISSRDGKPKYPVLVLTARAAMKDFFDSIDVDGFIEKPCDEAELSRTIREILARRRADEKKRERVQAKILIAEDEETVAEEISTALKGAGYDVSIVQTGPEVLEKASADKPDAIIMKEILPRLNGSAVASLLDVMPTVNSTPVIIYDENRTVEEGRAKVESINCVKSFLATCDPAELTKAVAALVK
jgi:DNA-binding response OmpR family regulator